MKSSQQRINNIIGQLEGIKRLLELKPPDCSKLIMQLKAVKSATASLMEKIVQEELEECLQSARPPKAQMKKIFSEIIKK